jgi:hypothetical protein
MSDLDLDNEIHTMQRQLNDLIQSRTEVEVDASKEAELETVNMMLVGQETERSKLEAELRELKLEESMNEVTATQIKLIFYQGLGIDMVDGKGTATSQSRYLVLNEVVNSRRLKSTTNTLLSTGPTICGISASNWNKLLNLSSHCHRPVQCPKSESFISMIQLHPSTRQNFNWPYGLLRALHSQYKTLFHGLSGSQYLRINDQLRS